MNSNFIRVFKIEGFSWVWRFLVSRALGVDCIIAVSYTHLDVYKRQKYTERTSIAQTLRGEKSPAVIIRTTQRIEHLKRRISNLLNWPGDKVTPPDVQKFAEEADVYKRQPLCIVTGQKACRMTNGANRTL